LQRFASQFNRQERKIQLLRMSNWFDTTNKEILYNYCTSLSAIWCVMEHIILHKMKCCNCCISFSIPSVSCVPGSILRDSLLVFSQIQKHMIWSI
jgi:hypothetical protein